MIDFQAPLPGCAPEPGELFGARSRLEAEHEVIVQQIYRAGAGFEPWIAVLDRIAEVSAASSVNLAALDKGSGTVVFSYVGGPRPPEAATEYISKYRRIDPRLALLKTSPVGKWLACQDYFDEHYVARDPFYQNFLIPYGSRYTYGVKVLEDEAMMVVFAHHRPPGNPLVDPDERNAIERLPRHIAEALRIHRELSNLVERDELGYTLLDRLHEPVILLDRHRNITFRSEAAKALLECGDMLWEHHGTLVCRNPDSDVELTLALRGFVTSSPAAPGLGKAAEQRRMLRLRRAEGASIVMATLLALPSTADTIAIGHRPRALLAIHEPGSATEIDPFFLASAFNFTPTEARVAARLIAGLTLEEIASESNTSITTVRTHLRTIFDKTGANRQAELVRLLAAAMAF